MPVDQDIGQSAAWFVGEDKVLTFTVRDQADAPVSIAGWTLEWVLRIGRYYPLAASLTKATGSGITVLAQSGGTLGQFTVQIDRADTLAMKAGTYYHAARRTNAGNSDIVSQGAAVLRKAAAV